MMCQTGGMPRTRGRAPAGGRAGALSREIVVAAAIALLDELGERGLTFRLLAERLNTGSGALYWHVANKSELLDDAADTVVAPVLTAGPAHGKVLLNANGSFTYAPPAGFVGSDSFSYTASDGVASGTAIATRTPAGN